jgi:UDP-hydrolysing UDP-N-acetyl-D-glucosamine 2-epimerase
VRTVGVVTVGRSDYGIYLPVLRKIQQDPDLELRLIVGGAHLSPEFGSTWKNIAEDGFPISERVEFLVASDSPLGIAKSMGLGTAAFAEAYSRLQPDILLVLGDRFEMHAATEAAVPFLIPVAHMGGGAVTVGAIDDVFRHSITKMSHIHFAETKAEATRIVQMGEEPWRVMVTGAASLDNIIDLPLLDPVELSDRIGLDISEPCLLVTYHPVTMEYRDTEAQIEELLAALNQVGMNVLFTYPNADTHGHLIINKIQGYTKQHTNSNVVENLGTMAYFSVLNHASAMVGNSSSGIIESASFQLPVVNIGTRQLGRTQARNVINAGYDRTEIFAAIKKACEAGFRKGLKDLTNPYGDGTAATKIVDTIKGLALDDSLLKKGFYDSKTCVVVPERGAAS